MAITISFSRINEKPVILYNNLPIKEIFVCTLNPIKLTTSFDKDNFEYEWKHNGISIPNSNIGEIWVDEIGTYIVLKKAKTGNQDYVSEPLTVTQQNSLIPIKIQADSKQFCEGEKAILTLKSPYQMGLWFTKRQNLGIKDTLFLTETNRYYVSYGNDLGCVPTIDSVDIQINPLPENPSSGATTFYTCKYEDFELIIPQKNNYIYEWYQDGKSKTSSSISSLKINEWGTYKVRITNNVTKCSVFSNDFLLVEDPSCDFIKNLYIPTAFTPNNDGINDLWEIRNINNLQEFSIQIFNKWGNLIFQSINSFAGWDGKFNNDLLMEGMYFFKIKYQNKVYHEGIINLLR